MRLVPLAAATLVVASLMASCGDGTPRAASTADPATTSAAASDEKTIPDGTYSKREGGITYALKVSGNRWTGFIVEDGAAPEPGDLGTLEYDDEGDVAMVSESTGCPQCVYTYDWRLSGDRLSLTIVRHESTDDPAGVAMVRVATEGDFRKRS